MDNTDWSVLEMFRLWNEFNKSNKKDKTIFCSVLMTNVSPIMVQAAKGSPLRPWGHLQMGLWLTTEHSALTPQLPGQGSLHFWLTQALESSQSELTIHSGRQVGGLPIKPSIHLQTAIPFTSWQWLFGPQGDGEQGFCIVSSNEKIEEFKFNILNFKFVKINEERFNILYPGLENRKQKRFRTCQ